MADAIGFGAEPHAACAVSAETSRGRVFAEPPSPTRTPYQRDRDRVVHSTAFRRLKHKTQVFVYHEGDHFRTRLTHSIEVAQIARAIARALRLDDDLAEALALAHDLGHTPFGHAGEDVLQRNMAEFGGFDHNAQSLRIVCRLERRYPDFDGLNLTWETLEGLVKHNGPLTDRAGRPVGRYVDSRFPAIVSGLLDPMDLMLWSHAGGEAQAAAISDDIAYDAHDLDDGLRAGLFTLADLGDVPLVGDILRRVAGLWPGLDEARTQNELVRRLITAMVEDVIGHAVARLEELRPRSADDIREAEAPVIGFSAEMAETERGIKRFLFANMYRNPSVLRVRKDAEQVLDDLFGALIDDPGKMPEEWAEAANDAGEAARARIVCDYIAGMTDRYALNAHRRLFDDTPDLL